MYLDCISANSTPTLQSFHPPELKRQRYRHLKQPIVVVKFAVANHNRVLSKERRNLTKADLFGAVATALFHLVHPPPPADVGRGPFRFLLQWEDELVNITASLEVIWLTGSDDVIRRLITAEQFSVDLSNIISRTPQQNTFNGILNFLCW